MVESVPYQDRDKFSNEFVRRFSKDIDASELVWHRDHHTRTVEVLAGLGWHLQLDNQLPLPLLEGESYQIPRAVYHRIWTGTSDLILKIREEV